MAWTLWLAVLVAMTVSDFFDVAKIRFVEERRPLLTALSDYSQEVGALVFIGGPTAALIKYGVWSVQMLGVLVAMGVGSYLGTRAGGRFAAEVDAHLDADGK